MLPASVQDLGGGLDLLLPLMLCCMMPMLFRQPKGGASPETSVETDTWFVTYEPQEAYDAIVKKTDEWRESATSKRGKSRFSFSRILSRKEPQIFVVDEAVPHRLYRLNDDLAGELSFELTEVTDGSTSIKATYSTPARNIIQNFKTELPIKIFASSQDVCSSCGKEIRPDFTTCPYCGVQIDSG